MDRIKDNFKSGGPVTQVSVTWFNQVASFINNLVNGYGIKFFRNRHGIIIALDPEVLPVKDAQEDSETTKYWEAETPSDNQDNMPAYHKGYAYLETQWNRDGKKGVKVFLPTDSFADGASRFTMWRLCEFDRNGCLQKVGLQSIMTEASIL